MASKPCASSPSLAHPTKWPLCACFQGGICIKTLTSRGETTRETISPPQGAPHPLEATTAGGLVSIKHWPGALACSMLCPVCHKRRAPEKSAIKLAFRSTLLEENTLSAEHSSLRQFLAIMKDYTWQWSWYDQKALFSFFLGLVGAHLPDTPGASGLMIGAVQIGRCFTAHMHASPTLGQAIASPPKFFCLEGETILSNTCMVEGKPST